MSWVTTLKSPGWQTTMLVPTAELPPLTVSISFSGSFPDSCAGSTVGPNIMSHHPLGATPPLIGEVLLEESAPGLPEESAPELPQEKGGRGGEVAVAGEVGIVDVVEVVNVVAVIENVEAVDVFEVFDMVFMTTAGAVEVDENKGATQPNPEGLDWRLFFVPEPGASSLVPEVDAPSFVPEPDPPSFPPGPNAQLKSGGYSPFHTVSNPPSMRG
jgi:hypothetical protein